MVCISHATDGTPTSKATNSASGSPSSLCHNAALLQRSSTAKPRPRKIGSTRFAGPRKLLVPFSHQPLEMFLTELGSFCGMVSIDGPVSFM
ncbi:hypothetical protein QQP08_018499 [Theobroma cacao]|nr:hypothetical protein QQP08_018499 [Theobroma cacao]